MNGSLKRAQWTAAILAIVMLTAISTNSLAYDRWSIADDATNCGACHGDFRSNFYTSAVDGQMWGNIHNLHRFDMLDGDCDTCHLASGTFPVMIADSAGGDGLDSFGCMGCHGRAEDDVVANPEFGDGMGAGLRQKHFVAGVSGCIDCHADSNPANYTTVGEEILPAYYANPGNNHPNIPTSSCNDDGSENFAGDTSGLDNDGDGVYDTADSDCDVTAVDNPATQIALLGQNVPNPFNPETVLSYVLSTGGWVKLRVYDASGNLVRDLVDSMHDQAGTFSVQWDGQDNGGREMASGVYYSRLEFAGTTQVGKMTLLK